MLKRGLAAGHRVRVLVRGPAKLEATHSRGQVVVGGGRGLYRVGWVGVDTSLRISRDDLADFTLTRVEDQRFVGHLPFVSN